MPITPGQIRCLTLSPMRLECAAKPNQGTIVQLYDGFGYTGNFLVLGTPNIDGTIGPVRGTLRPDGKGGTIEGSPWGVALADATGKSLSTTMTMPGTNGAPDTTVLSRLFMLSSDCSFAFWP